MKEFKKPIAFLLYCVGAYPAHIVVMDLITFVERMIYHGQAGL